MLQHKLLWLAYLHQFCDLLLRRCLLFAVLQCESDDLQQCGRLWGRVASAGNRWSGEWGLQALAAAQRLELSLAGYADDMCSHTQVRHTAAVVC